MSADDIRHFLDETLSETVELASQIDDDPSAQTHPTTDTVTVASPNGWDVDGLLRRLLLKPQRPWPAARATDHGRFG